MGNTAAKPLDPTAAAAAAAAAQEAETAASPSSSSSKQKQHPKSSASPRNDASSKSPKAQKDQDEEDDAFSFRVLSTDQRAVTFDERMHLPSQQRLKQQQQLDAQSYGMALNSFRPLQRASTYDPRLRLRRQGGDLVKVSDVMYRRFFNAKEKRLEDLPRALGAKDRLLDRIVESPEATTPTSAKEAEVVAKVKVFEPKEAVVIVDPMSTGQTLAQRALDRGLQVICVYSDTLEVLKDLIKYLPKQLVDQFTATVFHDNSQQNQQQHLDETVQALEKMNSKRLQIVGVLPGAETGVLLADQLSERLGLRTNGTALSQARRNKYLMGEKVRDAGLRAVKQRSVTKWSEIEDFLVNELKPEPFRVIVKPVASAGSDDVSLCKSMDEVKKAFGNIQGKINHLGLENTSTLVQEYLNGTEYVVDTVSRDGKHKVVAMWEYDKREVNGAPFVYFGVLLRAAQGEICTKIADYVLKVVEALGIKNGPAHAEVKYVNNEPCLVEIGSRCHGGEGVYVPIVNRAVGYNQVDATLDSYFDADSFNALPERPLSLRAFCGEAMFVSYQFGVLESYPGFEEIRRMPSFFSLLEHTKPNDTLHVTVDMFTTPGSALLLHESEEQFKKDYNRIRELEHDGLYKVKPIAGSESLLQSLKKIVVVVDPFSTGAVVAHTLAERGYECICVYSDRLENVEYIASLVPAGMTLSFAATIAFEGKVDQTVKAIKKAARGILEAQAKSMGMDLPSKVDLIHAVLPGAEPGVRLADAITDSLGLAGNIMKHTAARRDKFLMGETLRKAGVRAVKQVKATSWEEARRFIEDDLKPSPFEVVLKPLESAGTEDVVLCVSMEQAEKTFNSIIGKTNGLGIENIAVLLQEYLEGDEYVVDTVSRNGVHKVTAVWKYDKRRVNDAAFVYFGLSCVPAEGIINELIDYQFQVLDALGFKNGPGHGEVKFCRGSPVLIEVGARCHGGEGTWVPIANKCIGYNQVDITIAAFLNPEEFEKIPERPTTMRAYGCEATLVIYRDGILRGIPGLEEIEKLPSFLKKEIFVQPGDPVQRTRDMFTTPGSIMFVHEDKHILDANLARVRELEFEGLFEIECVNAA